MSIIGGIELGRELARVVAQINGQIEAVRREADSKGIAPSELRDTNGNWVLIPLLVAKVQALHALVLINQRGN